MKCPRCGYDPLKPGRSTGYRSVNSHTHGHYADIALQLSTDKIEYSPDEIGRALKTMAMKAGVWPPKHDSEGNAIIDPITKQLEPMSERDSNNAESCALIEYIHWWADINRLWLTEYIGDEAQRIYGGEIRDNGGV